MRKIKLRGVTWQAQITQLKPEGLIVEPRSSDSIRCSFQDTVHSQRERRTETSEKASIEAEGAPMSFPCSLNPQPTVHSPEVPDKGSINVWVTFGTWLILRKTAQVHAHTGTHLHTYKMYYPQYLKRFTTLHTVLLQAVSARNIAEAQFSIGWMNKLMLSLSFLFTSQNGPSISASLIA